MVFEAELNQYANDHLIEQSTRLHKDSLWAGGTTSLKFLVDGIDN